MFESNYLSLKVNLYVYRFCPSRSFDGMSRVLPTRLVMRKTLLSIDYLSWFITLFVMWDYAIKVRISDLVGDMLLVLSNLLASWLTVLWNYADWDSFANPMRMLLKGEFHRLVILVQWIARCNIRRAQGLLDESPLTSDILNLAYLLPFVCLCTCLAIFSF